jgi:hypothetical protein
VGEAAPLVARLTRFGCFAKGLVTIMVGGLALRRALGRGGSITGQEGAIRSILDEPFGIVLLAIIAAGLAGYALWMFVAAFIDPERKGTGFTGIAERVGFFVTGIAYALLAWGTLMLLLGRGGKGMALDDLAAAVLTPWVGRSLVGLAGATVMVAGVLQLRLGITAGFRDSLRAGSSKAARLVTVISGRLGYMALGVMSLLVGSSLVRVAVEYDPSEAGGWDQALQVLSAVGEGGWLLAAAATGLILYGVFFVLLTRYREV